MLKRVSNVELGMKKINAKMIAVEKITKETDKKHTEQIKHLDEKMTKHSEALTNVASKDDLKAVQASVQEVVDLIKKFRIGVHVSGRIFGISGKVILYVGALCTSIVAIYIGIKWFFGIAVAKIFGWLP